MKERAHNGGSGDHKPEEEERLTMKEGMEEEVAHHRVLQEDHHMEATPPPQGLTYPPTYNPFPLPTMQNQWENSPMSSMGTEPKQKPSLTSSTTTFSLTLMSWDSIPLLKRSPLLSC